MNDAEWIRRSRRIRSGAGATWQHRRPASRRSIVCRDGRGAGLQAGVAQSVSVMVSFAQRRNKIYPLGETCITMNIRTASRLFVVRDN